MKSMLIVLLVVAIVTILVFGFSISGPLGDADSASGITGQFLVGGSLGLGLEIILILVVLFTAYSLLKRNVVEY